MIKRLDVLGVAIALLLSLECYASDDLDQYGGLKSVRFEPSGFFRVEKKDRWWFVTPEGSGFLSFGMNHPNKDYARQDYNVEFWKKKFGVDDPYSPAFLEAVAEKAMKDMKIFGMNTLGCHALKQDFGKITVPYVQALFFAHTAYWLVRSPKSFPDVFSDNFVAHCDKKAKWVVLPKKDDPYLMGYTFTNVPILTDVDAAAHGQVAWGKAQKDMPTWPRVLRNHGPAAPGKQVYVSMMRDKYAAIKDFNRVYKTTFSSFDDLLKAKNWCPFVISAEIDDAADNHAFLLKILDRYYSVACAAVRKYDGDNHMIFGDPLNADLPPPDDVIALITRYTDVLAYQFYGGYDEQLQLIDRWSKLTGKPLLHTDSCFSVAYEQMPTPIGALCPDQETRAKRFLDFATRAFARPDFIGWHWCGWMDSWVDWKDERQHPGLQDPFGRYQQPITDTMNRFGAQIYLYGQGKKTGGPVAGGSELLPMGDWAGHGLSVEQRETIRSAFRRGIDSKSIPGGSLLLIHDGEVIFREAFGMADLETKEPFTTGALCRLASVTKLHSSTVLAMLADRGKLSLDDPIDKYIEEFKQLSVRGKGAAARRPTIAECLSHTAGFPGNNVIKAGKFELDWSGTLEEVVSELTTRPLFNEPGTTYAYSRLGYMTAGRIAEVVTGKAFPDIMRELLLEPVGATNSTFYSSEHAQKQMPTVYERKGDGIHPLQFEGPLPVINPGGHLCATLDGVGRVLLLHRNHGRVDGKSIVSEEALAKMYVPQPATKGTGYGMGLNILKQRPDDTTSRVMHIGGSGTMIVIDFDLDLIVVVLTQIKGQKLKWRQQLIREIYEIFQSLPVLQDKPLN